MTASPLTTEPTAPSPVQQLLVAPRASGDLVGTDHAAPALDSRSNVTLPNALTVGRLVVVPALGGLLATGLDTTGGRLLAGGLFVLACLTDVIDGHLARAATR